MPIINAPDSTVIETESLFFVIAYAFSVLFLLFFRGAGSGKGILVAQSHLGRQAINDKLFAQLSNLNK
jgi:hypothetical protein